MADKWACPKCGTQANGKHGRGGVKECNRDTHSTTCYGFVCECESTLSREHGTDADPCSKANCYHCGWGGVFPVPAFDPKKLSGWAKRAWAAKWTPPLGWKPSKKEAK